MPDQAASRLEPRQYATVAAIALGVALWALNSLISVTILPSAVAEIGGLAFLSWATTAYMTASIVTAAGGSWVKSRLGARAGLMFGGFAFGCGALVCAMAPSMPVLIAGRALGGSGAGVVVALCYMLIRSAFPQALWPTLFAIVASVWGIAAMGGPALGGWLTQVLDWRWAFIVIAVPAFLLSLLAVVAVPRGGASEETRPFPVLPLSLLAGGIVAVALTGNLHGVAGPALAAIVGLVLIAAAIAIGRGGRTAILPRDAASLSSPVCLGLVVMVVMIVATMPTQVFFAYALQHLHGLCPLVAGYVVALEALAWTAMALLASRLPVAVQPAAIRLGPWLILAGMLVGVAGIEASPLLVAVSTTLAGAGFGISWSFMSARVMRGAAAGDEDRAASAIPLMENVGVAFGAALAGTTANALGLATALDGAPLAAVMRTMLFLFLPLAGIGIVAAHRLAAREPRPATVAAA